MMTNLPTLNLTCLKNPQGRCVLIAESCVNCRNYGIVLAYAAAYQKEFEIFDKARLEFVDDELLITNRKDYQDNLRKCYEFLAARDAVLKIAGLTEKDLEVR